MSYASETAIQVTFWGIPIPFGATSPRGPAIYNLDQHPLSVTMKGVAIGLLFKMAFNYASAIPSCRPITDVLVRAVESLPYVSDACDIVGTDKVISVALCTAGAAYKLMESYKNNRGYFRGDTSLITNVITVITGKEFY